MSNMRVALVAEGKTDLVIIEAALKAILPNAFVLTLLQPEATRPEMGEGWGGVFKWCSDFRRNGYATLKNDPTLGLFDLFIVHLDADVAEKSYADCGRAVAQAAVALPNLPCAQPCPPPTDTVDEINKLLLAWLGILQQDEKTVFCIPSKASEAWLAAALLPQGHALLAEIECKLNLETSLSQLPKAQRIRKSRCDYLKHAQKITSQWEIVRGLCSQAEVFHQKITAIATR